MTRPVAVITGASDGIGAALARIFAANGHEVALVARRGDRLEALADEIAANGAVRPLPIELDLTEQGAADVLSERLAEAGAAPRFLVNNAGFGLMGRAIELDAAEQLAIVDLNMRALTALTLRFLPAIVAVKGGVLNVASVAAFMPGPGFAVYYATKAYVRSFSEALSQELKPLGVKVACLCPGPVQTGFQARAGMDLSGFMTAIKPAMLPAAEVARQGYEGLMAGKRVIVPGLVNRMFVWGAAATPRALLLPLLASAQQRR
ncbi:SDR family NAD(P)-dependent oxidoreductase [Methylocystis rosea]|uniref:SDR family oxidoreductase n=1 Tax=Methylocystis rosea TaxID=173366 RepID=A0A3G8M0Z0_9HYPH|nr:SDR family oxidoreductase [Methylocystis rosea]AZG75327.1 SDR family oxidoreductase [Methylocystis rosea]